MRSESVEGVQVGGALEARFDEILTPEALEFVAALHREFNGTRATLLRRRAERQAEIEAGGSLDFLPETRSLRESEWTVAPVPADLQDRRVEITGPTDRKMTINALNSGARCFMADFEDANSPTWRNMIGGHVNLIDSIEGKIEYKDRKTAKEYRLGERTATLLVRPRGWHLPDRHILIDGEPVAGAFVDFGFYFFHNADRLLAKGTGPYFYLPKLQSHREARLWNDVFTFAEDRLDVPAGATKATVLIETIWAAFEMDEILYELREHSSGLNAGRWDYQFSLIKTFKNRPEFLLPDRNSVKMTVPFMRAYTELLVKTCHRRGAHAMGGMSAFVPSRKEPERNERALDEVGADKRREATDGFDGTWVAHPDSVPVATKEFDLVLGERPNQIERQRDDVQVRAPDLLNVAATPGDLTEDGLRNDCNVGIQYISSWLRGNGAAGIYGLMEDAATAEIARSQVWQWVHTGAVLADGRPVTKELVRDVESSELERIRREVGNDEWFYSLGRPDESRELFERVALADEFQEFLTLPAYEKLLEVEGEQPTR
jgi:malate synthase